MNNTMIDAEVRYRMSEVRQQAARCRAARRVSLARPSLDHAGAAGQRPQPQLEYLPSSQGAGLRGRIGLTLVETGLHLLASGSQSRA